MPLPNTRRTYPLRASRALALVADAPAAKLRVMRSAPIGLGPLTRASWRAPARVAPVGRPRRLGPPPVTPLATGSVYTPPPRRLQKRFYAFAHYVHTSREPSASPFPASSHKIVFCPLRRPRRARFRRSACSTPVAPGPQSWGPAPLVGPAPARVARHGSGPPRTTLISCPKCCAAGFASRPVTRRAPDPAGTAPGFDKLSLSRCLLPARSG